MSGNVKGMTTKETKKYLDEHDVGDYNLIDVRQDWEYEEFHIPGARLIPLPELPDRMKEIDPSKPTLVYCASGRRSASAASLMDGQGFGETYNILGGIMAWKNEYAIGPQVSGMTCFSGTESPVEILALAYNMEANLGSFYSEMAFSAKPEIAELFRTLSNMEEAHKTKIYQAAQAVDPLLENREDLEKKSHTGALEGGMTASEFMEQNTDYLKTPKGALETAMMFEAQALDLYMRYSEKAGSDESVALLHQLAQEEKRHLQLLGKLMVYKVVAEPS